jgi:hypothetical protein
LGLVKKTVIPFLTEDSILRLLIEILAGIIETKWHYIFGLIVLISFRLKSKHVFISGR